MCPSILITTEGGIHDATITLRICNLLTCAAVALTSKNDGKSAAIGAVAGAAAGGAIAVATKGPQLELPPGQRLAVELTRPVEVQIATVFN